MKLNVKAFAFTCAIIWGLGMFLMTWWVIILEGAWGDATILAHIYRGYTMSPLGSVIGLLWGLVDGFIGGLVFAWLYNLLVSKKSTA